MKNMEKTLEIKESINSRFADSFNIMVKETGIKVNDNTDISTDYWFYNWTNEMWERGGEMLTVRVIADVMDDNCEFYLFTDGCIALENDTFIEFGLDDDFNNYWKKVKC